MNKKKLCFVITTRGNYAKLKPVIREAYKQLDEKYIQIVVAGGALLPKYGNIISTVQKEFPVARKIPFIVEGEDLLAMAKSSGIAISEFSTAFDNLQPDCVILVGDRYETLAIAMAAAYMNIPVAHLEGGEVSGSIDESIRHAITKMAHIHFPCSGQSAERIIKLGEPDDTVHDVGTTSLDALVELNLTDLRPVADAQHKTGVGPALDLEEGYLLVLFHPVTTEYEQNRGAIASLIGAVHELALPTIWLWPNMDAGSDIVSNSIRSYREKHSPKHIHFFKGLPIELFGPALYNCSCIVGNSSCGIRESAYFGIPSVTVGSRQGGRERGRNVISVLPDRDKIIFAVKKQLTIGRYSSDTLYGNGDSAKHIIEIILQTDIRIQKKITF